MNPAPYWSDETVALWRGDCLGVLRGMEPASVDAIVTDPPYGLEFMGKEWDRFGRDTGNGYREKPRLTSDHMGKGFKELPNHFEAGRPYQQWCDAWATECLRVLKPGGHMLAFGGTRTWHRLTSAIEDAGFEIRDSMSWLYGSGFPKSLDVSKAIDKMRRRDYVAAAVRLGMGIPGRNLDDWTKEDHSPGDQWWGQFRAHLSPEDWQRLEREVTGSGKSGAASIAYAREASGEYDVTAPATEDAARWSGWGTALKPAWEPVIVARKPLAGTVAGNILAHGTGALNIDGCRVDAAARPSRVGHGEDAPGKTTYGSGGPGGGSHADGTTDQGRWPANVLLTHSAACEVTGTRIIRGDNRAGKQGQRPGGFFDTGAEAGDAEPNGPLHGDTEADVWACAPGCPVAELDRQSGVRPAGSPVRGTEPSHSGGKGIYSEIGRVPFTGHADAGGASRFFPVFKYEAKAPSSERPRGVDGAAHPTVKPLTLMSWLVRLVTPPGGLVLDPFAGSGTTAEACIVEGFRCVLIEKDPAYAELIKTRLAKPIQPVLFGEGF